MAIFPKCVFLCPGSSWIYDFESSITRWKSSSVSSGTLGMRGTGSKDLVVNNAFIPEHRAMPTQPTFLGLSPHAKAPTYRLSVYSGLPAMLSGSVLGMAEAGLRAFVEATSSLTFNCLRDIAYHSSERSVARAVFHTKEMTCRHWPITQCFEPHRQGKKRDVASERLGNENERLAVAEARSAANHDGLSKDRQRVEAGSREGQRQ